MIFLITNKANSTWYLMLCTSISNFNVSFSNHDLTSLEIEIKGFNYYLIFYLLSLQVLH